MPAWKDKIPKTSILGFRKLISWFTINLPTLSVCDDQSPPPATDPGPHPVISASETTAEDNTFPTLFSEFFQGLVWSVSARQAVGVANSEAAESARSAPANSESGLGLDESIELYGQA